MTKLPKRLIKKYGISKKAWSVYRSEQKVKTHRYVAKKRVSPKRKTRRKSVKAKPKRKSGNMNFNFGGGLGKGIAVGVAAGVVNRFIPVDIAGADYIIAGMLMKDKTVQKLGAITLGRSLAGSFTGMVAGGTGNGNGGEVAGWL